MVHEVVDDVKVPQSIMCLQGSFSKVVLCKEVLDHNP